MKNTDLMTFKRKMVARTEVNRDLSKMYEGKSENKAPYFIAIK
jgi:hypothetical protein